MFSYFPKHSEQLWGSPSLQVNGRRRSVLGTKRPERGTDHSAPHSVKVESEGSRASISPVPSRHVRDNFIFHFNITDKICDLCFSLTLPFYKVQSFVI